MRFAPQGIREMAIGTVACAALAALALTAGLPWLVLPVAVFWLLFMNFFRDPERTPREKGRIILSPADGRITDVTSVEEGEFIRGPAVRIGIFMDVFSVHVNRSPVTGTVAYVRHHPGKFFDARSPRALTDNEHLTLGVDCEEPFRGKVAVRLIAGKFARRIVCGLSEGDRVEAGRRIGMIKLGSRVEVFVPEELMGEPAVKVGDDVKAGRDTLVRYE